MKYDDDANSQTFYKIHSIRSEWYPGQKVETFNIKFNPAEKTGNWRSEPDFNNIDSMQRLVSKTPVYIHIYKH